MVLFVYQFYIIQSSACGYCVWLCIFVCIAICSAHCSLVYVGGNSATMRFYGIDAPVYSIADNKPVIHGNIYG